MGFAFALRFSVAGPHRGQPRKFSHDRAGKLAALVRFLLWLGFVVVVAGPTRCGKSVILQRATPGRVFDTLQGQHPDFAPHLEVIEQDPRAFSVDEAAHFLPGQLSAALESCGRLSYALAVQRLVDLDGIEALKKRRRIVLQLV